MKNIIFWLLVLFTFTTKGQNLEISGGYTANKWIGFDHKDYSSGFFFNAGYRLDMNEQWGLRPMVTFSQLGSEVSYRNPVEDINITYSVDIDGLSIGSDLYYNASRKVEMSGGLHFTWLFNLDTPEGFNDFINAVYGEEEYEINNLDILLFFKFRYNVEKHVFIEGFFRQGILEIDEMNQSNHNTGLGIGLGIKF